jgi:hypothetical protein
MWLYVVSIPTLERTMTKRGKKAPSDKELKEMVVIFEYLAKDVANGTIFVGVAYSNGPPFLDKIEVSPSHSLCEVEK